MGREQCPEALSFWLPSFQGSCLKRTAFEAPSRAAEPLTHLLHFEAVSLSFGIACNFYGSARLLPSLIRKWLGRSLALPISPQAHYRVQK